MKIRAVSRVGAAAGLLAIAAGPAVAATAARHPTTGTPARGETISCAIVLYAIGGHDLNLGTVRCGAPAGVGVQRDVDHASVSGNAVRVTGRFTQYFDHGTLRGTVALTGSTQTGRTSGTVTVTGGTGVFATATGTGRLRCRQPADSTTTTCTARTSLKLV
jgi:hypothetical protein